MKRWKRLATVVSAFVVAGFLGIGIDEIRSARDERRMDALAERIEREVSGGMSASEASGVLDRIGVDHSGAELAEEWAEPAAGEERVISLMVRHREAMFQIVTRDVQVRIYLDGAGKVTRVVKKDVFTGP